MSQPSVDCASDLQLSHPSSLPKNSRTLTATTNQVNDVLLNRLSCSASLDKFMRTLKDKCPIHFGNVGKVVLAEHHRCTLERDIPMNLYGAFKFSFSFDNNTYCSQCGLPQSCNGNGEEPACHAGLMADKRDTCPFAGFIFKAVFSMWHREGFRTLLQAKSAKESSLNTYPQFLNWIVQECTDEGKYSNLLEVFLWFCSEVEKAKPRFFD